MTILYAGWTLRRIVSSPAAKKVRISSFFSCTRVKRRIPGYTAISDSAFAIIFFYGAVPVGNVAKIVAARGPH